MEFNHPEVAFRSCNHCRKYVYDEDTGEPRKNIRTGELLERANEKTLPCVAEKCHKGHYSNPLELSLAHRSIVDLYKAVKATGGAILTEAERTDPIVALTLACLDTEFERAKTSQMSQTIAAIILRGGLGNG